MGLVRDARFRPEIRVAPADGGRSRRLLEDAQQPAWAPDGLRLAFSSTRDRHWRARSNAPSGPTGVWARALPRRCT